MRRSPTPRTGRGSADAGESAAVARLRALVTRLPEARARDARVVETHISLLLLSGAQAWKFKKPVRLPFADFTAAAERKRLCHAEVTLNRRLAPTLYLGVDRVTGTPARPRLGGRGRSLEHAVHMRRFAPEDEACQALAEGRLGAAQLWRFGADIAAFHAASEVLPATRPLARPGDIARDWEDDVAALGPVARGARADRIEALAAAWSREFLRLRPVIRGRRAAGCVRACHGDLHLHNLVLLGDRLTAFDCIEFNDEFRFIDTCNEVAFLFMDLERMRRPLLARAFLDGYLQHGGDYAGLVVLHLFAAYRASVRAKIAALRLAQLDDKAARRRSRAEIDACLATATRLVTPRRPGGLLLMHGLSGSGKSRLAAALAEHGGCLLVRSDVARRRLYRVEEASGRRAAYAASGVRRTYRLLCEQARPALCAGFDVIVDATFLAAAERARFLDLAARVGTAARIVHVRAPLAVLEERVAARAARGDDASQADIGVLRLQLARQQPLQPHERRLEITVNTDRETNVAALWRRLRRTLAVSPERA